MPTDLLDRVAKLNEIQVIVDQLSTLHDDALVDKIAHRQF
jgi:hypothetical protein